MAAATAWIGEPSQTPLRWPTDDVIEEGPMRPRNGMLPVPADPGLGVTLSRQGQDRCHARFLDEGPYDHDHDSARSGRYRCLPLA